ncbi:hypothetical protein A2Z33_03920 [Candidatus Gottesmanbacteria bacterium RBG_16_52_11]|uniref:NAD-dependent epimerase/dehydratase domain-containing protein n=1 Tax=Candidatus Gottesmanbacteria bacterium RBG_16_52_11 TaxID=1798374 RepID=A0A1F5YVQ1_9BACT|nr:MAG: hypothetical protein A2Z33_03920 [Candidatus Gottesmanbacteria bacterium RBG_16_52_11]
MIVSSTAGFMKQTAVVTGASGFVGSNIVRRLLTDGYRVHALVRKGGDPWRLVGLRNKLVLHEGVLDSKSRLTALMHKVRPQAVFHLATYGSYPTQIDLSRVIRVNVNGTANLLESTLRVPYTRLIVAGSSSEYGKKDVPMREDDAVDPNNMYAAAKTAATTLARTFARVYRKPVTIFRLFSVYGPGEEKGRLVRSVIESALAGEPVRLASGREARDLIYTADIADAFVYTAGLKRQIPDGEIFNIGTGVQTTIRELAQKVIRLTGSKSEIKLNAYAGRLWDAYTWKADTAKTRSEIGWTATTGLTDGLKKTIDWYRSRV